MLGSYGAMLGRGNMVGNEEEGKTIRFYCLCMHTNASPLYLQSNLLKSPLNFQVLVLMVVLTLISDNFASQID